MTTDKLYTRDEICELLGKTYTQLNTSISSLKIKPAVKGRGKNKSFYAAADIDKLRQYFADRETRQAVREIKRRDERIADAKQSKSPKAIPARRRKSQATIAADNGQHDEITTEFIIACEKYQRTDNVRWMRKSDYLQVLKSMGHDWLERFLNQP